MVNLNKSHVNENVNGAVKTKRSFALQVIQLESLNYEQHKKKINSGKKKHVNFYKTWAKKIIES